MNFIFSALLRFLILGVLFSSVNDHSWWYLQIKSILSSWGALSSLIQPFPNSLNLWFVGVHYQKGYLDKVNKAAWICGSCFMGLQH